MKNKTLIGLVVSSTVFVSMLIGLATNAGVSSFSIPTSADPSYTLTLDSSTKAGLVGPTGSGVVTSANGNELTLSYDNVSFSNDGLFATFIDNLESSCITNLTPLSGIKSISVRSKTADTYGDYIGIKLSVGEYTSEVTSEYQSTSQSVSDSGFYTKTFTPTNTTDYNYFAVVVSAMNRKEISIESITVVYSCSRSKDNVNVVSNDTNLGSVSISGTDKAYKSIDVNSSVTITATPANADPENGKYPYFDGWYDKKTNELVSKNATYEVNAGNEVDSAIYAYEARFVEYKEVLNEPTKLYTFDGNNYVEDNRTSYLLSSDGKYYSIQSVTNSKSISTDTSEEQSFYTDEVMKIRGTYTPQGLHTYPATFKVNTVTGTRFKKVNDSYVEVTVKKFESNVIAVDYLIDTSKTGYIDNLNVDNATTTKYSGLVDSTKGQYTRLVQTSNITNSNAYFYPYNCPDTSSIYGLNANNTICVRAIVIHRNAPLA